MKICIHVLDIPVLPLRAGRLRGREHADGVEVGEDRVRALRHLPNVISVSREAPLHVELRSSACLGEVPRPAPELQHCVSPLRDPTVQCVGVLANRNVGERRRGDSQHIDKEVCRPVVRLHQ